MENNFNLSQLEAQLNEHGETLDEEELSSAIGINEAKGNDFLMNLEKSLRQGKPIDESVAKRAEYLSEINSIENEDRPINDNFDSYFDNTQKSRLNEIKAGKSNNSFYSTPSKISVNIDENAIRKIVAQELSKNKELIKENFNKINETIYESYIDTVLTTLINQKVKTILEENERLKKNQTIIIKTLKKRGILK